MDSTSEERKEVGSIDQYIRWFNLVKVDIRLIYSKNHWKCDAIDRATGGVLVSSRQFKTIEECLADVYSNDPLRHPW